MCTLLHGMFSWNLLSIINAALRPVVIDIPEYLETLTILSTILGSTKVHNWRSTFLPDDSIYLPIISTITGGTQITTKEHVPCQEFHLG